MPPVRPSTMAPAMLNAAVVMPRCTTDAPEVVQWNIVELQGTLSVPDHAKAAPNFVSSGEDNDTLAVHGVPIDLGTVERGKGKKAILHIGTLCVEGDVTAASRPTMVLRRITAPRRNGEEGNLVRPEAPAAGEDGSERSSTLTVDVRNRRKRERTNDDNVPSRTTATAMCSNSEQGDDGPGEVVSSRAGGTATSAVGMLFGDWFRQHQTEAINDALAQIAELSHDGTAYVLEGWVQDHYVLKSKPSRTF